LTSEHVRVALFLAKYFADIARVATKQIATINWNQLAYGSSIMRIASGAKLEVDTHQTPALQIEAEQHHVHRAVSYISWQTNSSGAELPPSSDAVPKISFDDIK
jgi:hypothetical protein